MSLASCKSAAVLSSLHPNMPVVEISQPSQGETDKAELQLQQAESNAGHVAGTQMLQGDRLAGFVQSCAVLYRYTYICNVPACVHMYTISLCML